MNNVCAIALRSSGLCLRPSPWPKPSNTILRSIRSLTTSQRLTTSCLDLTHQRVRASRQDVVPQCRFSRQLSSSPAVRVHASPIRRALGPLKPKIEIERGLAFGEKPLNEDELEYFFGDVMPSPPFANRLLRVIHGRRVDGTLDMPLPEDVEESIEQFPHAFEAGLAWLRENYDIDEDEAILARIKREESGYDERTPSELRQRAQDLKLYGPQSGKLDEVRKAKSAAAFEERYGPRAGSELGEYYGPQSGRYQAKLGEGGDVYGQSKFEEIRAENEAASVKEEAALDEDIEKIQAKRIAEAEEERSQALAVRPEQGIEVADEIQPPNLAARSILRAKKQATSDLTLDSPEIKGKTLAGRLLPSFVFVILFCTGCWLYTLYWKPPKRSDRIWKNMSLSFATITGITAINVGIFLLWRFPPAWRMLNRFFLVVPAKPSPFSMFGNIFSHVRKKHLFFNMLPLLVFGPTLHEEMGRGNFLALYLASGVIGSFASLTHHAARGILYTSSLGASGSIWAVTGAFFSLYQDNNFTFFFIPDAWKDEIDIKGWMLFSGLIVVDIISGLRGKPVTVDYVAHASGALSGWMLAEWFRYQKRQSQGNGEYAPRSAPPWWRIIIQGGDHQDKGGS